MSTYRERRGAKAERLREWADKRETKADSARQQADDMASIIPFGQPVLRGHHSEGRDRRYRDRIGANMDKAHEHATKAAEMRRRADGIEAAADRAIYSDDPDAREALAAKLARLEAERDRIKAYNASCRKGTPDVSLLDSRQVAALESAERFQGAYQERRKHQMPAYALSNLSGTITTTRKRLDALGGKADA